MRRVGAPDSRGMAQDVTSEGAGEHPSDAPCGA